MATSNWPDDLVPYQQSFWLQPHVGRSESPFTRQQKVYGLSAPRWVCRMSFRGGYDGTRAQGAFGPRLDAFLAKLKGGVSRVGIYDFRRTALRGDNDAADLTNEAAVAGATSMRITGADANSLVFMAGDYIGGDGRPHVVTDDATANAAGLVVVRFEPALNANVAAGMALYGDPRGQFRLVSDDAGSNDVEVGQTVTYSMEFVEDYWEVDDALARAPFGTMDCSDAVPNATDKFKGKRHNADNENFFLFRQYIDATGFIEEYVYLRIHGADAYNGVNDGLQLMSKRTIGMGRVFVDLIQPEDPTARTTTEFASRFGLSTDDYADINENANGFGHGNMTSDGVTMQQLVDIMDRVYMAGGRSLFVRKWKQ